MDKPSAASSRAVQQWPSGSFYETADPFSSHWHTQQHLRQQPQSTASQSLFHPIQQQREQGQKRARHSWEGLEGPRSAFPLTPLHNNVYQLEPVSDRTAGKRKLKDVDPAVVKDGKQKGPTGKRHRGGYDPRAPVVDERGRDLASTQRIGSTRQPREPNLGDHASLLRIAQFLSDPICYPFMLHASAIRQLLEDGLSLARLFGPEGASLVMAVLDKHRGSNAEVLRRALANLPPVLYHHCSHFKNAELRVMFEPREGRSAPPPKKQRARVRRTDVQIKGAGVAHLPPIPESPPSPTHTSSSLSPHEILLAAAALELDSGPPLPHGPFILPPNPFGPSSSSPSEMISPLDKYGVKLETGDRYDLELEETFWNGSGAEGGSDIVRRAMEKGSCRDDNFQELLQSIVAEEVGTAESGPSEDHHQLHKQILVLQAELARSVEAQKALSLSSSSSDARHAKTLKENAILIRDNSYLQTRLSTSFGNECIRREELEQATRTVHSLTSARSALLSDLVSERSKLNTQLHQGTSKSLPRKFLNLVSTVVGWRVEDESLEVVRGRLSVLGEVIERLEKEGI